jgi:uncharacterized iron-regulated protein
VIAGVLLATALTGHAVVADGGIAAEDVAAQAGDAMIVILGEVHDNPAHHVVQAEAIAALNPRAVVFEMLSAQDAALVTRRVGR